MKEFKIDDEVYIKYGVPYKFKDRLGLKNGNSFKNVIGIIDMIYDDDGSYKIRFNSGKEGNFDATEIDHVSKNHRPEIVFEENPRRMNIRPLRSI